MSMTDPIADMLTRIRNGQAAAKAQVSMPSSTVKTAIAQVFVDPGVIIDIADNNILPAIIIQVGNQRLPGLTGLIIFRTHPV